ncbi:unnamed protein product, partial [Brenthis ino]
MLKIEVIFVVFVFLLLECEPARILGIFPVPVHSHQSVFRTLTNELVRRGHQVTVVTGLPVNEVAPENYTEIDVSQIGNKERERYLSKEIKPSDDMFTQYNSILQLTFNYVFKILQSPKVDTMIKDKNQSFDLIFIEDCTRPGVILSHFFKAPVISISSYGGTFGTFETTGAAVHPFLYPLPTRRTYRNLSIWDKLYELYVHFRLNKIYENLESKQDEIYKEYYGSDIPRLNDLSRNIKMLFLNIHPIWDSNRPIPPNIIYLGGLHQKPQKELPKDLKLLLDSSSNGAIYMSLGTFVDSNLFHKETFQIFINVFSKLPYDVYWKWNGYEMSGLSKNVKVLPWFPQPDVLRHPNIKLFITQGGLQSTDEAITAGVPLIGIPIIFDQFFNTNKYVELKIGQELDVELLNEENLSNAINEVINDKTYKNNVIKLRSQLNDTPLTSLDRAVFWTEYVLKHGADHLKTPSANMHWFIYYEMDVALCTILLSLIFIISFIKIASVILKSILRKDKTD